jgi:S-adenosylmethionine:tRNA ribosyltransferase-isomerase
VKKSVDLPGYDHLAFDYDLPETLIALHPSEPRSAAKLLHWNGKESNVHCRFDHLPNLLPNGSQLWMNDTRVIRARLLLQKETGGRLEIFLLEPMGQSMEQSLSSMTSVRWRCMVRGGKKWKNGLASIRVEDAAGIWEVNACRVGMEEGIRHVELTWKFISSATGEAAEVMFSMLLESLGRMPLPPYMRRLDEPDDASDYQTVYAEVPGSVAAPTAGLHYDENLLAELSATNSLHAVTLHVGAGTFKPLAEGQVREHVMHGEKCTVSFDSIKALSQPNQNRIATGTTTLRTLESLYWLALKWRSEGVQPHSLDQWEWSDSLHLVEEQMGWDMETAMQWLIQQLDGKDWEFETAIMMAPPYQIRSVQALITNFHMPQSTLLCLVACAIGGHWRALYETAMDNGFKFLSYGDGSLLQIHPFRN